MDEVPVEKVSGFLDKLQTEAEMVAPVKILYDYTLHRKIEITQFL